jgi:two-component system, OmpR family, phosphate regulon sensor histidine kinase PhoR
MKRFSPRLVGLSTALIALLGCIIIAGTTSRFSLSFSHWLTWVMVMGVFAAVFFYVYVVVNLFVYHKINPIYKTIHDIGLPRKKLRDSIERKDLIRELNNEVLVWARNNTREIDQLKQLEKYRKEFLGNVSHELKTPIFNIQGYVLTLLDGGLEDPTINRLYLERTEKSINRMISIVEDLESISRLESGELKLEMEDFNLQNLVEDSFEMQEMLARKMHITLSIAAGSDKGLKVRADKKRVVEVLNNLVVNSIKYGKKGGKTTVSMHDMGEQVLVEVTDSGIGIQEKDIARIFERFYRTDKSRSRDQGGTGLGLSIVKHIIEAHNQTISVRSNLQVGSTFSFTLQKAKKG